MNILKSWLKLKEHYHLLENDIRDTDLIFEIFKLDRERKETPVKIS